MTRADVIIGTRSVKALSIIEQSRRSSEHPGEPDMDQLMVAMLNDRAAAGAIRAKVWINRVASWLGG